jgi:hypothetical protein
MDEELKTVAELRLVDWLIASILGNRQSMSPRRYGLFKYASALCTVHTVGKYINPVQYCTKLGDFLETTGLSSWDTHRYTDSSHQMFEQRYVFKCVHLVCTLFCK